MSTALDVAPAPVKRPSGLNARLVAHAVRRRPLAVAGVVLLAAGAGAGVWVLAPLSKTTATASFRLSPPQSVLNAASSSPSELTAYRAAQANRIRNRLLLSAALGQPEVRDLPTLQAAGPEPLAWLEKSFKVDARGSTGDVLRVTLEGDNGADLTAILGAIAKVYLVAVEEEEDGGRRGRQAKLQAAADTLRKEINEKVRKIDLINQSAGGSSPFEQFYTEQVHSARMEERLRELRAAKRAVERAREARDAAEEKVARVLPTPPAGGVGPPAPPLGIKLPAAELAERVAANPKLGELDQKVAAMQARRDRLLPVVDADSEQLRAANRDLAAAEAQRDAVRAALWTAAVRAASDKARGQALDDLEKTRAAEAAAARTFEQSEQDVRQLDQAAKARAGGRLDVENLRREIAAKDDLLKDTSQKVEHLAIEIGKNPPRVSKAEDPYVVAGLEGNKRLKYTLGAVGGVLLLGFAGLIGWEARSRRVTHTDDATADLGLRLLGTVPPTGGNGQPGAPPAALAEAIDTARTMLLHGTPAGAGIRTVLVTSGVAGEGKTSLAGHLAISLARAGFRTVLVDGDLQSPAAHRLFDCPVGPGLCELLRDEIDAEEATRPTPVPGLAILPAGRWDTAARQALVGDRWRRLKADLEGRYDFVVVDTAPLLLVSDTLLLAREADGVVLSVLLGVSQVSHVAETAGRLRAVGAKLTGAVVNGVWHDAYRSGAAYRYAAAGALANGTGHA